MLNWVTTYHDWLEARFYTHEHDLHPMSCIHVLHCELPSSSIGTDKVLTTQYFFHNLEVQTYAGDLQNDKSILTTDSHLHLSLSSTLFPWCFLTKTLYAFLASSMCDIYPAHYILTNLITLIIQENKLINNWVGHSSCNTPLL